MGMRVTPGQSVRTRAIVRVSHSPEQREVLPVRVVARSMKTKPHVRPLDGRRVGEYQRPNSVRDSEIPAIIFDIMR
jgi:hypothetical protein